MFFDWFIRGVKNVIDFFLWNWQRLFVVIGVQKISYFWGVFDQVIDIICQFCFYQDIIGKVLFFDGFFFVVYDFDDFFSWNFQVFDYVIEIFYCGLVVNCLCYFFFEVGVSVNDVLFCFSYG